MPEGTPQPRPALPPALIRHREGGITAWLDPGVAAANGWDTGAQNTMTAVRTLLRAIEPGGPGQTLKEDARSLVRLIELGGRRWVVKRYRAAGLRTWLGHLMGQTTAWRECRGAARLRRAGLRANVPLALIHAGGPFTSTQTLVLPFIPGPTLSELIAQRQSPADPEVALPGAAGRLALARATGRQVGLMSAAGIINRDHKPANLVIDDATFVADGQPAIIDTVGIRGRRQTRQVWMMLAVMLRAARRVGPVTARECLACLKAALAADPSLAAGARRPVHDAARAVLAIVDARPLSYEPKAR